jgi:hypothetical protein
MPSTTIPSITAIINPEKSAPGKNLPAAAMGQRYLVIKDVPENTFWGNITNAKANDILEFNGTEWVVSFNSSSISNAVVLNTTTGLIYEWKNNAWISAYEGTYRNGFWRLYL